MRVVFGLIMDLEKLRLMRKNDRVIVDGKPYRIYDITGDVMGEEAIPVLQYWMNRDEDGKTFVLNIPQEDDDEKYIIFQRAVKSHHGGWMIIPLKVNEIEPV